jgi:ASC-1-like (ASCH) protein
MQRTLSGKSHIAKKVSSVALPLCEIYILFILLSLKLYEVRTDTQRVTHLGLGDSLCFFAGKWTLYCEIVSVKKVKGTSQLLGDFDWFNLTPQAKSEHECKKLYKNLEVKETTSLIVWGVKPIEVRNRDLKNSSNYDIYNDSIVSLAKNTLVTRYNYTFK